MRIVKCWLCALFIILAVMGGGSTAAYAAEQEDWQTVNLTEVRLILERDNEWEDVISLENITVEATSDGHYRFNYNEFAEQFTFSERDWSCYQVDWVIWEDKENFIVYDNGSDGVGDDGYVTFGFVPPDEIGDMPFDMYFYFEVRTYETKVTVVNNVNSQTATIVCDYIYEGEQVKTRISTSMFSKNYAKSFYYLFDTPGYMFSGKSNYTFEDGYVDYYVCTSSEPGVTLVLEFEKPYVLFTSGEKEYKAEMSTYGDGYAFTVLFETPILLTSSQWSKLQTAINEKNIVQDDMLTNDEYGLFSAAFNQMFGMSSSYRVDGFTSAMPISFLYFERPLKEKSVSLEGIRFELGSKFENEVEVTFSDEVVVERNPTTGENINNVLDEIFGGMGEAFNVLKIIGIVALGLIALLIVENIIKAFVRLFKK